MKKLTIVMPALNEEMNISEAISDCLTALEECGIDGELIVINDGSADRTAGLMEEKRLIHKDRIRVIDHDRPEGVGACFWDGVDNATGEYVLMIPADNENDCREILQYMKLLDDVDMVVPFVCNKETRSIFRNLLSHVYRLIINTTFNTRFNYTNGTVLYRTSALKDTGNRSRNFFFQTDILIRLTKKGYLSAEVPCRLRQRHSGRSKALGCRSFLNVTRDYFKLARDIYGTPDIRRP